MYFSSESLLFFFEHLYFFFFLISLFFPLLSLSLLLSELSLEDEEDEEEDEEEEEEEEEEEDEDLLLGFLCLLLLFCFFFFLSFLLFFFFFSSRSNFLRSFCFCLVVSDFKNSTSGSSSASLATYSCDGSFAVKFLPSTFRFSANPLFLISAISSEGCIDGPEPSVGTELALIPERPNNGHSRSVLT